MGDPGSVYVLLSLSQPGLLKVGLTKHEPEVRARKLRTTGVAKGFIVLWHEYVSDAAAVEAAAHEELAAYRADPRREFFEVVPKVAISCVMRCAARYRIASPLTGDLVPVLERLRAQFGTIIDPKIDSALVIITEDAVVLRVTRSGLPSVGEATRDDELDVIWDVDAPMFSVERTAEWNAKQLLALDEYTLTMTTDLIDPDEGQRIWNAHNPPGAP
jgi:hypothetical protein